MTKPQLIESVAAAAGQSKTEVEHTIEAILDRVSKSLAVGDCVELRCFCVFEAKESKARIGRNPANGESIEIPASKRATFRPRTQLEAQRHA